MIISTFTKDNFYSLCYQLGQNDKDIQQIIDTYGLPPIWIRPATFQTLVLTIIEQQISLASAYAAYKRLQEKIGIITPEKIINLTDEELKACYFSRQKIIYVRALANAIINKEIVLKNLAKLPDEEVRFVLKKIKGIGDWTVDVYLMHALQRTDLFPLGDVALVNSLKHIKQLPPTTTKIEMLKIAEAWKPNRTIACMLLWHAYIKRKRIQIYD